MEEFEKLYTVNDIAKMTSLTSRTIRNYLKDGNLRGSKIGGQWRFTMKDIKRLFNNTAFTSDISHQRTSKVLSFLKNTDQGKPENTRVCTIADRFCGDQDEGQKLYQKLVAVINHLDADCSPASFNYEFNDKTNKARFILFGDPEFIIQTLKLLNAS